MFPLVFLFQFCTICSSPPALRLLNTPVQRRDITERGERGGEGREEGRVEVQEREVVPKLRGRPHRLSKAPLHMFYGYSLEVLYREVLFR